MNKKILLISSMLLTLVLISIVIFNNTNSNESNIISNTNKDKQVINNNMITMMYETEAGSGEYVETKDTTWPESDYIFNDTLSGCENGGKLSWNQQTNKIILLNNTSDKCYLYFDVYNKAIINNVISNVTNNSINVNLTITAGENPISKYYYSINNESYIEQENNSYTFNMLNENTTYNIKVYVVDSLGISSKIYSLNIKTDEYTNPTVSSISVTGKTQNSISVRISAIGGTNSIATYHYSIDNGTYVSSTSNTRTFSGLGLGTTHTIKVYVTDTSGAKSNIETISAETERGILLADYIKSKYTSQGANGLYYHTSSLANSAEDNSYRYAGSNPNNYVCFGADCSNTDNIYRIIGVFENEVKLIKINSIGKYPWDSDGGSNISFSSSWNPSDQMNIALNTTYLNSLDSTWSSKIATHSWKVGGFAWQTSHTAKTAYNYEVGQNSDKEIYNAKIGLMYVSDYGYAASTRYWSDALFNYDFDIFNYNWMYLRNSEWTISTRSPSSYGLAMNIQSNGGISYTETDVPLEIRPCFYLNSNVIYLSGSGTRSDPIKID